MQLNNLFDTRQNILDELANYGDKNQGYIEDHIFEQACNEFGMDEDDVMLRMMESKDHKFYRTGSGFTIFLI